MNQDYFDTTVLIVLATSGLIPISLLLALITRYGRQSWYVLTLSWITTFLASTTLIASYYWTHKYANEQQAYNNNLEYDYYNLTSYDAYNSCALPGSLDDYVIPLCGNSNLLGNQLSSRIVANWWTWLVFANCIIWMFFCLGKKCYDVERLSSIRERVAAYSRKSSWIKFIAKEGRAHRTWILISFVPWSLCFASQFFLFSEYFKHRVISYDWSFGQIIAIFVWVPSLVEYTYIEFSKYLRLSSIHDALLILADGIIKASAYKYPSPLVLMREVAGSTISLANLQSPEMRKGEDSTWSPEVRRDDDDRMPSQAQYSLLNESRDLR